MGDSEEEAPAHVSDTTDVETSSVAPATSNGVQDAVPAVAGKEAKSATRRHEPRGSEDTDSMTDKSKSSSPARRTEETGSVKNGKHANPESRTGKRVSHDSGRHTSRSTGRKHNRFEHKHKSRKNSTLPSDSGSRKRGPQAPELATDSNHEAHDKSPALTSSAEKRTRVVLHIYEEILQNGVVVDSKVKETEFITSAGSTTWPILSQAMDMSQTPGKSSMEAVKERTSSKPQRERTGRPPGRPPKHESSQKRSSSAKAQDPVTNKKSKGEEKGPEPETEEAGRIDIASTLLSLRVETPSKKVKSEKAERQDNFHDVIFQALREGNSVMAKWTDKNFYAGCLSSNLGDGRWHVVFDDGGKKAVNESDIISVPHLSIGQLVMATFSDGSLCLKGIVRQPFYEKNRLYYHVEYNDGVKSVTEKFCRRDIFLTPELAATLLNKQSKGSDKLTKFADVDLNNIIPKRSRLSAQSKAMDGSTDDSEPESSSSSVKNSVKIRKAIHSKSGSNSHTNSSLVVPTSSKALPKSPEKNTIPPQIEESEPVVEAVAATPAVSEKPETKVEPGPVDPQDLLGPIPATGSTLFKGMTFLLTTADAGNSADTADSGRSSSLFDIPHLILQIEGGGGRVHQTLESAQEVADCKEIVLLACTYLRTVKYMQCLAAGIPCVMHTWLIECCRKNELLDKSDYLLPSGYSIISNSLINDRSVFAKSCNLFYGVRFMLVSKNPRHAESWTSVLTAAKAVVVEDLPSSSGTATRKVSTAVDVIISDSTCPQSVIKRAQQMKIPIVSSEYVVQCLINGLRLDCEAHEKFGIGHK